MTDDELRKYGRETAPKIYAWLKANNHPCRARLFWDGAFWALHQSGVPIFQFPDPLEPLAILNDWARVQMQLAGHQCTGPCSKIVVMALERPDPPTEFPKTITGQPLYVWAVLQGYPEKEE